MASANILIIDDDESVCTSLALLLKQHAYSSVIATCPRSAMQALTAGSFDLILQDMNFTRNTSGEEGLALLADIRKQLTDIPIILITAWATIELAVAGIKSGANDFVSKPWDNQQLIRCIQTNLALSQAEIISADREELDQRCDFSAIIGEDPALLKLLSVVARVAQTDAPVLILGETGTGKELIADAIHKNSKRAGNNLIKVNLSGIPTALFESEMFGHVRGAFTDAHKDRSGRFTEANGGSLFLDEIGDLEPVCQAKLLRVLEDQSYQKLGNSNSLQSDTRIISATSKSLSEMVAKGVFREDLLYRLNLITLELPPLRQRQADIPAMANYFLSRIIDRYQFDTRTLSPCALQWLQAQAWPGNIRQLKQTIERAVLMSDQNLIKQTDFIGFVDFLDQDVMEQANLDWHSINQGMTLDQVQANMIKASLDKHAGNISKCAKELGVSRAALYRRMDKYAIET